MEERKNFTNSMGESDSTNTNLQCKIIRILKRIKRCDKDLLYKKIEKSFKVGF
jgi:hypothetical protein